MRLWVFAVLEGGFPSLADPVAGSPLRMAADWVAGTLLGSFATVIAVIALAAVGLSMLTGRIRVRKGLTVLAGCFVLFGAPTLARGLRGALEGAGAQEPPDFGPLPALSAMPLPPALPDKPDPYAGATLPSFRSVPPH